MYRCTHYCNGAGKYNTSGISNAIITNNLFRSDNYPDRFKQQYKRHYLYLDKK